MGTEWSVEEAKVAAQSCLRSVSLEKSSSQAACAILFVICKETSTLQPLKNYINVKNIYAAV